MSERFLKTITDPSRDIYERRYIILVALSVAQLLLWTTVLTVSYFHPLKTGFYVLCLLVESVTFVLVLKNKLIHTIPVVIGSLFALIVVPFAFFFGCGVEGGAFNWSVMAFVFIYLTIKDRAVRNALLLLNTVTTGVAFGVSWLNPPWVITYTPAVNFRDNVLLFVIMAAQIATMFIFQLYVSDQERKMLAAQKTEIEELNRAQNRFFSSMSHEIRTPINSIIGLNEMNMRDENASDEVVENNRNIQGASRMLLSLINDILDKSKIESGKMDIVPVSYETGAMLSEVVNMIWGRAEGKGLKFHVNVDPSLPTALFGDEVRIKQVLINLLNNAVKYTQEGSITLSVQCDRQSEKNVRVTWRVEDTGMGIRKEVMPGLFDAFRRVDEEKNRSIEGTGLGLSIVKQIADLMGGEITVDSVYTKGSTFAFSVPQEIVDETGVGELHLHASRNMREREQYRQSFEAPGASLLIVDDNELNLQVESKLLAQTKLQIDLAKSGRECLSMTFRKKYDVIFMDHLMPEMDGIDTISEVRSQRGGLNRETPVLILTANAGSENQALYAASGFDGCLLKPVSGQQLEAALLNVLPPSLVMRTGATMIEANREAVVGRHVSRRRIVITCDSCADLPEELLRKYHIPVINQYVRTEEGLFFDNTDVDSDALMQYLDDPLRQANSEPPTVADFERFFAEQLTKAQHVIHVSIGKRASESFANAEAAAAAFGNVDIFDSTGISGGTGLLALFAAYQTEREENVQRLLTQMEQLRQQIRMSFILDSAALLARGGRIRAGVYAITNALMLHPMIRMRNSATTLGRVFGGEHRRYRRQYVRYALRKKKLIDNSLLFITHVGLSEEELSEIVALVEAEVQFDRVIVRKASSTIAVNCGRGTFGLFFRVMQEDGEWNRKLYTFLPEDIGKEKTVTEEAAEDSPAEETTAQTQGPIPAEEAGSALQKLYRNSGTLDYDTAMKYLAGEELMEKTLQQFYESITKKADEIERMLEEDDFENFTIKVHALKSSARLIGAEALSENARKLEDYGRFIRS